MFGLRYVPSLPPFAMALRSLPSLFVTRVSIADVVGFTVRLPYSVGLTAAFGVAAGFAFVRCGFRRPPAVPIADARSDSYWWLCPFGDCPRWRAWVLRPFGRFIDSMLD